MKKGIYLLLIVMVLAGCKSSKRMAAPEVTRFLSSKVQLTLPAKGGDGMTVGGNLKMKSRDRVQISLLMPVFRTEVARLEITPHDFLLVDRVNKRYVRASREELKGVLPKEAEFSRVEKLLLEAALPGGKKEVTGKELGLPSMEKARLKLYDFSDQEFVLTPTEVSNKYTQVSLEELMKILLTVVL